MKRNKKFLPGMLIMALIFGIALFGCDIGMNAGSGGGPGITYTVEANGKADEVTSTQLIFTFDTEVSDLRLGHITITNTTGRMELDQRANKGHPLTGGGTEWILHITNVQAGRIRVKIDKDGVERGRKTLDIYKDSATGEDPEQAISLSPALWEEGYFSAGEEGKVKWYKFTAEEGVNYHVQLRHDQSPQQGDYRAYVAINVYKEDRTTEIKPDGFWSALIGDYVLGEGKTVYVKITSKGREGKFALRFYDPEDVGPRDTVEWARYSDPLKATIIPSVVVQFSAQVWALEGPSFEAKGFKLYRSDTKTGDYDYIADANAYSYQGSYFYIDTDVQAGKSYWYKAEGYNDKGVGEWSEPKASEVVPGVKAKKLAFGTMEEGEVTEQKEADWYTFEADPEKTYTLEWESFAMNRNGWSVPPREDAPFTAYIRVSVFSAQSLLDKYQDLVWGYGEYKQTLSGLSGTVYIKVEADGSWSSVDPYGTYSVTVSN